MFHLMMLFAPILFWIFAAGLLALLLTGVGLVIAALAGGTSAALLVRNKMARRLLLCGCGSFRGWRVSFWCWIFRFGCRWLAAQRLLYRLRWGFAAAAALPQRLLGQP